MTRSDDDLEARQRVAAWVQFWMNERERQGYKKVTKMELERLLGVGKGTASRLLAADRLGIDVFLKVRRLLKHLHVSADRLLDDWPPGWPNHSQNPSRDG